MTQSLPPEAYIELTRRDLEDIIESAAKRGAERALQEVGMTDKDAVKDVQEMRTLMGMWREMRTTALRTFVQAATVLLLGIIAVGATMRMGMFDFKP